MSQRRKRPDLLPCPFCGAAPEESIRNFKRMSDVPGREEKQRGRIYWIGCFNSYCWQPRTYASLSELAEEKWQKRTSPLDPSSEVTSSI